MFRLFDWQCSACGSEQEALVDVPAGRRPAGRQALSCDVCNALTSHHRCAVAPIAEYHGERVMNPMVNGGRFDTTGHAALPELPTLPQGVDRTSDNLKQHFESHEWKEARAARKAKKKENAAKQRRANLIRQGKSVNMRADKLPGDPKITA